MALRWASEAAEQGIAEGQYNLAWMHIKGKGVEQNEEKGAELFRKAAEQGHANAQLDLGWLYYEGKGVTQDFKEAVKWYCECAEYGTRQRLNKCSAGCIKMAKELLKVLLVSIKLNL